jgi:hypothetical protein
MLGKDGTAVVEGRSTDPKEIEQDILGSVYSNKQYPGLTGSLSLPNIPELDTFDFMPLRKDTTSELGVVYTGFSVSSAENAVCFLLIGSENNLTIWLNGVNLWHSIAGSMRAYTRFSDAVPLKLVKGENRIVIKINKVPDHWELSSLFWELSIAIAQDHVTASSAISVFARSRFLENQLLDSGLLPKIEDGIYVDREESHLEVFDCMGARVLDEEFATANNRTMTGNLPDGSYEAKITWAGTESTEFFVIGNPEALRNTLLHRIEELRNANFDIEAILPYIIRLNILLDTNNRKFLDPVWNEKFVYALCSANQIASGTNKYRIRGALLPGFHLLSFRSAIDGQLQNYGIYIPESIGGIKRYPLIIETPYVLDPLRPFLSSALIAHYDHIMLLGSIASRYGCALVFPYCRGNSYGNTIYQKDIEEVLIDLSKRELIDQDRIYLYGTCSGGMCALLTAELNPSRFAAVSVGSPVIYRIKNRWPSTSEYIPDSPRWLYGHSPLSLVDNLRAIPVQLIYYELWAHTPPLWEDSNFVAQASQAHVSVSFQAFRKGEFNEFYAFEESCKFFQGKQRNLYPDDFTIRTSSLSTGSQYWATITARDDGVRMSKLRVHRLGHNITVDCENVMSYRLQLPPDIAGDDRVEIRTNGQLSLRGNAPYVDIRVHPCGAEHLRKTALVAGPISHAFGTKFILVRGTIGTAKTNEECAAAAVQLNNGWHQQKFTDCSVKDDIDVTQQDIETANLVLIGSNESNLILRRIWIKLPIKRVDGGVAVGGHGITTADPLIVFCYPNPENIDRYVVVVTSLDSRLSVPPIDFSLDGQFDYIVGRVSTNGFRFFEGGYFDESWSKALPLVID